MKTREGYIPAGKAELYYRETGQGQPVIILHGGPDFDHNYLLPEMDRLADAFRLIYYDQRGRGKSAGKLQPEEVSLKSEIEDLEAVREFFQLEAAAVLGHSWGGVLAMEYAVRHPRRVSHMILMNTAPASHDDYLLLRQERRRRTAAHSERLKELSSSAGFEEGDLETDAAYYRILYGVTLRQPELLDRLVKNLRYNFTKEGILKARKIEDRLMDETWLLSEYNLFPALKQLHIPTLVIHGDYDLVPVECAARIAEAISGVRFVLMKDTGHFSYLERPEEVRKVIEEFM